jgi:hypothetical protein
MLDEPLTSSFCHNTTCLRHQAAPCVRTPVAERPEPPAMEEVRLRPFLGRGRPLVEEPHPREEGTMTTAGREE